MEKSNATSANDTALPVHHTERDPYHMALYLQEGISAASHLVDAYADEGMAAKCGIHALLTILEERAKDLALELDCEAGSTGWKS